MLEATIDFMSQSDRFSIVELPYYRKVTPHLNDAKIETSRSFYAYRVAQKNKQNSNFPRLKSFDVFELGKSPYFIPRYWSIR